MSDVPNPDIEDEETEADGARVITIDDPSLPDFEPRRPLQTWETPEASVTGVPYAGDEAELMSAADREAFVRAAMARED